MQRRIWPDPASHRADLAQWEERHLARVEAASSRLAIRSTSGVPRHHRPCAAAGTAGRDVHGVAPHVQRGHLAGMSATRAWTQPKWNRMSCSSSGRGSLTFTQETRVRFPYTTPPAEATRPQGAGRKPAAKIGRLRNPSPESLQRSVNSVARVPPCRGGSRGFDSRTDRHSQRSPASSVARAPVYETGGRTFESCAGLHFHLRVAQLGARVPWEHEVVRSIRTAETSLSMVPMAQWQRS